MSTVSAHEQVLEARDLPLQTVTIFTDRAELKRVFNVTLQQGLNNIVIDNVCDNVEPDSIRVDGKGAAIIHEVQFKYERATNTEVDSPKIKELVKQLDELESKKAEIADLVKIYTSRMNSIDKVVENLGELAITNKESKDMLIFNSFTEENLNNFYGYHEKQAVELNSKIRRANTQLKELNQQIDKVNSQLNVLRSSCPMKRSICIALETVVDEVKSEIELTYQAYNASWTPSYDIRVSTHGKKPELKLIYYGNLRQITGEDWNDARLVLSTAKPRMGGQLPEIGTLQAQFRQIVPIQNVQAKRQARSFLGNAAPGGFANDAMAEGGLFGSAAPQMVPMAAMRSMQYEPESHVLSTTFTVPQNKSIPSDGADHKVTIATLILTPVLHFDCVPSKNTNVYLTASMLNSSNYPLLAGTASVYVDNSFSAKIELKAIASGEKFDCSLGVDPTIKVQYKPVHKYQQHVGMLTKSSVTINEQKILIKNTKQEEPIVLTFVEHVPKSTDEKIKIKLHSPELKTPPNLNGHQPQTNDELFKLKTPEAGAYLNDSHNLVWTVVLSPQEEKEYVVKWGVEYPPSEQIDYVERF